MAILVSSIDEEEAECEWVNRVFTEVLWVGNDFEYLLAAPTECVHQNVRTFNLEWSSTTKLRFSNFVYLNYLAYITIEYIVRIIKITTT